MSGIEYKPTPDAIAQSPELADLMTQMIRHVNEPGLSPLKQTVRWQFWTRKIYDLGRERGAKDVGDSLRNLADDDQPQYIMPALTCRNGEKVDKNGRSHGTCLDCEGTGCDE